MRVSLICTVLLAACAGGEKAPEAPAGPAALTAADMAGTWSGSTKVAGTDSVASTWTSTSTSDSTGTITIGDQPPVAYTVILSADSMVATSATFIDPAIGTEMLMWQSVGRLEAPGVLVGTVTTMLAAKMDSVVARGTWRATKNP